MVNNENAEQSNSFHFKKPLHDCLATKNLYSKEYTPKVFPSLLDKRFANKDLIAYDGDLSLDILIEAYAKGIFPWYNEEPIRWYSPIKRMVFFPNSFYLTRSFKKNLRNFRKNKKIFLRIDHAFSRVIECCAFTPRKNEAGTWINQKMRKAYNQLHKKGLCHSLEIWQKINSENTIAPYSGYSNTEEKLIGGLYGVSLGKAFFGESMFSKIPNASKLALYALSAILFEKGFHYIDCQIPSLHLQILGATEISRNEFLKLLERSNQHTTHVGSWSSWANNSPLLLN